MLVYRNLSRLNLSGRSRILALLALLGILGIVVAGSVYFVVQALSLRADLKEPVSAQHVRVTDPITVKFSRTVDSKHVHVGIVPSTPIQVERLSDRLVIKPADGRWLAAKKYALVLSDIPDSTHTAMLKGFHASFQTQPKVGVSSVKVNGQQLKDGDTFAPTSKLTLTFTQAMKPPSVVLTVNGNAVTPQLTWSKDATAADVTLSGVAPYTPLKIGLMPTAVAASGDPVTDMEAITLKAIGMVPSNSSSGIGAGFKTQTPVEVVVENAPGSHPHSGLQGADIVYEYISEYSISRMTAIYFNNIPGQIGSVRSCRMIDAYLVYQYDGPIMCSGMSAGTAQYFWGANGGPSIPRVVNDVDTGGHFFRVDFKAAPHNLYTDSGRAGRVRSEQAPYVPAPTYVVDPPHPDQLYGAPAGAPSIGLHGVSYSYDGNSKQYMRFDHGAASTDSQTGGQIAVKNVIVMHVGFADGGWVEDENGGAHSIVYYMNGEGPAEIWSDGQMVQATWHAGQGSQNYWMNTSPPYFTDSSGKIIELNTGLTWIHVVGNGQNS